MNKETVETEHCDEHGDWKKEYQQVRVNTLRSKE